jgi:uncharacterized membrane protein YGL010W
MTTIDFETFMTETSCVTLCPLRALSCQRRTERSVTKTEDAFSPYDPMATPQPMSAAAEHWIAVYDRGLAHTGNRLIHGICAPIFLAALLGLLWCVPVPEGPAMSVAAVNWATLFAMAMLVYYFIMSIPLALGALPFVALALGGIAWLDRIDAPLLLLSSTTLLVTALGQFLGHRLESGGSLMRDVLYCIIAPIWVLAAIYRRIGIRY